MPFINPKDSLLVRVDAFENLHHLIVAIIDQILTNKHTQTKMQSRYHKHQLSFVSHSHTGSIASYVNKVVEHN